MVQVVKYFVPSGIRGTKNKVKYRRVLVKAWAAGVRQAVHITKMVARREAFRRNPNKMIIVIPLHGVVTYRNPTRLGEGNHRMDYGISTLAQLERWRRHDRGRRRGISG
jgi:hypothetical protein